MAIGAGMLYNWFGDYRLAFNIGGVLGLIAGVTALRIPERPLEPLANPVPVKS
jgi:hypothetical protein